jgi:hypothetical protein
MLRRNPALLPVPGLCGLFAILGLAGVAAGEPALTDPLHDAIDLHCHPAPDAVARSMNDLQLARAARTVGLRAIVLKNHYTETAARAQLAMHTVGGGIEVFGGIALNRAVGGINAEAVRRMAEMEGRRGRIVWLPTFDAEHAVRSAGENRPFVSVVADGRIVPPLAELFQVVARHGLILATGHSSAAESLILIPAARAAGIEHVLVTHALFPMLGATTEDLIAMARLGAFLEFSWLMHHTPAPSPGLPPVLTRQMVPLSRCVQSIRTVGAQHIVLSSDFGQAHNPPPPDGLRAFVLALHSAGITAEEINLMLRRNPARLLGLEP